LKLSLQAFLDTHGSLKTSVKDRWSDEDQIRAPYCSLQRESILTRRAAAVLSSLAAAALLFDKFLGNVAIALRS